MFYLGIHVIIYTLGVDMSQIKPNFTRLELGLSWIRKAWAWLITYHRLFLEARLGLHKSLVWPTSLFKSLLKDIFNQLIVLKPSEILTKKTIIKFCISNVQNHIEFKLLKHKVYQKKMKKKNIILKNIWIRHDLY